MVAAVSAFALFIIMFLPWYSASDDGLPSKSWSAWGAFSLIDLLLFIAIAIAIGQAVLRAVDAMPPISQPTGMIVAVAGGSALLLIFFRLISTPDQDFNGLMGASTGRSIGVLLGLFAAAGIAYGGYTSIDERLDQEFEATRVESRPRSRDRA